MRRLFALAGLIAIAAVSACARSDADATITTEVKSKLETDRIITDPAQIQVQTNKKVVTLSGRVESPAAQEQAIKLARSTEGVRQVVDNLQVTPGAPPPAGPPGSAGNPPPAPTASSPS